MSSLNCGVGGASAGGTLTELIALGAMDAYLIKNPNVTFFRFRYNKHTNFALEAITQSFQSQVTFGSDSQITLNRTGDLIYFMYIDIEIPGITACDGDECPGGSLFPVADCHPCEDKDNAAFTERGGRTDWYRQTRGSCKPPQSSTCADVGGFPDEAGTEMTEHDATTAEGQYLHELSIYPEMNNHDHPKQGLWAHWANAIGQLIVRRASLVIGGQIIDTLYSDYLYMWEELSGKPGKKLMEMIGKSTTRDALIEESSRKRRLYVPLPFYFTATSGNSLPLVSLQFHGVQIHVEFEQLSNLIVTSAGIQVDSAAPSIDALRKPVSVRECSTGAAITNNSIRACLDTTYVYLDIEERDRFATGSFEQLITQVQQHSITNKSSQVRMPLNFNHPIIELMWAVRRFCHADKNNYFNYSGIDGLDPVTSVCLRLNNLPRFSNRPGPWFRLVQPYQYHTNIPQSYVYCYSFALHPEEAQPSGACNFSRIDHVDLVLELQEELGNEQVQIIVYARNWNIMRYRDGLGGVGFSN